MFTGVLLGWVLGPGGSWLIALPLAGIAVEGLSPSSRWLVYVGIIAAIVLPMGLRHASWNDAAFNTLPLTAAILFVVMFTEMRLSEQKSREQVERLMVQLQETHAQLAEYTTKVEELATSRERYRLAREIHDNLGHYLTIVNVQIEAVKPLLQSDPKRALVAMNKAQELTRKGLTRVRESVSALRESPMGNKPLELAIASLVEETESAGIVVELEVLGIPRTVEERKALTLFRTAQEGLTNVRKHARASRVDIILDYSRPDVLCLVVRDNGVGAVSTDGGFGLVGIRERLRLIGATMSIQTTEGKGFKLMVEMQDEDKETNGGGEEGGG